MATSPRAPVAPFSAARNFCPGGTPMLRTTDPGNREGDSVLARRRRTAAAVSKWTACAAAAAIASAALAAQAPAQERPTNADQELGIILGRPSEAGTTEATTGQPLPRRPLMRALDSAGVADALDNARIDIFGH